MNKIALLDDKTIQKIAAGEVIEKPASIVKELIENSIDANSSNIIIEIKNGGKTYIRVTDDGDGIYKEDIDLAFKRHSTSKLNTIDDLYQIQSLGFRGEALASISSVAKVQLFTKTDSSTSGIEVYVEDGEILEKQLVGTPKGTTIICKDIFYNIPVRQEFLKSDLVETNRVSDIVYKSALGNPQCSFTYIRDDKIALKTSKNNNFKNHIYSVLGREYANNLIEVSIEDRDISIDGYISNNNLYRGNRSHQYIYVNGRYIENKAIVNTIEKEYKSVIPLNRFPVFILFIDINPQFIDVNIHPTKQEINFTNSEYILELIRKLVRNELFKEVSIPNFELEKKKKKDSRIDKIPNLFEISNDIKESGDFEKNNVIEVKDLRTDKSLDKNDSNVDTNDDENLIKEQVIQYKEPIKKEGKNKTKLENLHFIGIIFETYILAEDKINKELYIIDQHSAHERVMYEKFLKEFKNEEVNIQKLISADIFELTDIELQLVLQNLNLLNNLGFEIDIFGENKIIVRGVPFVFGKPIPTESILDIIDNLNSGLTNSYQLKVDKIMKIACVNSVKSGDKLTEQEVRALFKELQNVEYPYSCPHGRPTILKLSEKDIEKEFLRIT